MCEPQGSAWLGSGHVRANHRKKCRVKVHAWAREESSQADQRRPIDVPIVLAGGDYSVAPLNPTVAESLRAHGWRNVSVEVIANSGHQVIDEQPAAVADLLERYGTIDRTHQLMENESRLRDALSVRSGTPVARWLCSARCS